MKLRYRCTQVNQGREGVAVTLEAIASPDKNENERFGGNNPSGTITITNLTSDGAAAFGVGKKYEIGIDDAPADPVVHHESKDQPTAMNPKPLDVPKEETKK